VARPATIPAEAVVDQLFSQNTVGVAMLDREARYLRINDALAAMNRIPVADHIGRTMHELMPQAAAMMDPLLAAVMAGQPVVDVESAIDEHGGTSRTFRGSFLPIRQGDEVTGMVALLVERTEGARVEAALKVSQERLQLALEGTETGTFEWTIATNELVWSDNMGPMWGRDRGWAPPDYEAYIRTLVPEDAELLVADVSRAVTEGTGYEREFRVIWPDGRERWLHSKVHVLVSPDAQPAVLIGFVSDVDARRRREQAEQAAHQRLRALQSVTDVALTHLELDDLLSELLARVRDITGSDLAEVLLIDEELQEVRVTVSGVIAAEPASTVRVSLRAGDGELGALRLLFAEARTVAPEDVELVELVADRAAQAIVHARVFDQVRATAETLQRTLLPRELPALPGHDLAVRYLPGQEGAEVGGDFYDAFRLPDGRFAIAVGDVVGRGVAAAADMGQLRASLRAYAYERPDPAAALERLDRLNEGLGGVSFATIALLALDPRTGNGQLALAGHLPPIVRSADGRCRRLDFPPGLPLGAGVAPRLWDGFVLEPGDLVLLYTDGLVERRGVALDDRIDQLCRLVTAGPADPEELLDHVLGVLVPGGHSEDDVALVAVRRA
jgi:serine phosphatase RsbU (regulator of sigma subunit)/PAS domain-containing protein